MNGKLTTMRSAWCHILKVTSTQHAFGMAGGCSSPGQDSKVWAQHQRQRYDGWKRSLHRENGVNKQVVFGEISQSHSVETRCSRVSIRVIRHSTMVLNSLFLSDCYRSPCTFPCVPSSESYLYFGHDAPLFERAQLSFNVNETFLKVDFLRFHLEQRHRKTLPHLIFPILRTTIGEHKSS